MDGWGRERSGLSGVGCPCVADFRVLPQATTYVTLVVSHAPTSQSLESESAKVFEIPSSFFSFFGRWPDFFKGQIRFLFPTLIFKQQLFRSLSILHRIKLEKVGKLERDDVMAF